MCLSIRYSYLFQTLRIYQSCLVPKTNFCTQKLYSSSLCTVKYSFYGTFDACFFCLWIIYIISIIKDYDFFQRFTWFSSTPISVCELGCLWFILHKTALETYTMPFQSVLFFYSCLVTLNIAIEITTCATCCSTMSESASVWSVFL